MTIPDLVGTPVDALNVNGGTTIATPSGAQIGETLLCVVSNARLIFNDNLLSGVNLTGFTRVYNKAWDNETRTCVLLKTVDATDVSGTTYTISTDDPDNPLVEAYMSLVRVNALVDFDVVNTNSWFGTSGNVATITPGEIDALALATFNQIMTPSGTWADVYSGIWWAKDVPTPTSVGGESFTNAFSQIYNVTFSLVPTAPPPTVPDAPTGLTVTVGNENVYLSWTAPATGGVVEDYEVDWAPASAPTDWQGPQWVGIVPNTFYLLTGLTNGVGYVFRVRALNSTGAGAWSTTTGTFTPVASGVGYRLTMAGDKVLTMAGDKALLMGGPPAATGAPVMKRWNGSSWVPVVMKHGAGWPTVSLGAL